MENRRKHVRFSLAIAAEIAIGDETLTAETRDISAGGVSVILSEPLAEGGTIALSLILTQDGIEDPREEPFETSASVMWSAPTENGDSMMGLRFAKVSPEQGKRLERFLAALAANERGE
jgi:c-di-GMP-binding flagellar brake protein YcgR